MATQGSLFRNAGPEPVRRASRLPMKSLATVTVGEQDAVLLNLSERGMAIQTTSPLLLGRAVQLSFMLPDTFNLVECSAVVMWVDKLSRAGLDFCDLDQDSHDELKRWLETRIPKRSASERRITQPIEIKFN